MLEGLVTWFLNNYLGKYLENVDTHQLSISLLQGEVDLQNVPFRKDALRFIEPSLEVKSGIVGHIKLTIPVSRLRSEPWTLLLEKVSVVISPQKFQDYDEETDDQVQVESKLQVLDGIESDWRAAHESPSSSSYYPAYSSWINFGESYIGTILENLQIHIRDVHVRYEDDISQPGHVHAAGFILKSLVAQTCDETWSPRFVHRDPAQGQMEAFKIVEMVDMCAYLDTDTNTWDIKKEELPPGKTKREYIVEPISATATIKRHCHPKPLNSRKVGRIVGNLQLNTISVQLSDIQYQRIIGGGRSLGLLKTARKHWRWRPNVHVTENPRKWWKYAITCSLHSIRRKRERSTLLSLVSLAKDNVMYVEAFMNHLENPASQPELLKIVKDHQDQIRSYEELKALREIAVIRLKRKLGETTPGFLSKSPSGSEVAESKEAPEAPSVLQQWFPLYGGWYGTQEEDQSLPKVEEFLQSLKSMREESEVKSHKDVVFSHLEVHLDQGSLRLLQQGASLLDFQFSGVKLEHESRPRVGGQMLGLTVGSILLRDQVTKGSLFPLLISPQTNQESPLYYKPSHVRFTDLAKSLQSYLPQSLGGTTTDQVKQPLLDLLLERKPFFSQADYRVHVRSAPLDIVLNPAVVRSVVEFFRLPEDINQSSVLSDRIKAAAFTRLQEAKLRTQEEFTRNLNQMLAGSTLDKKVWDVMLDLSAPKLLIPDQFDDKQAALVVIDFGKFQLNNQVGSENQEAGNKEEQRRGGSVLGNDDDEDDDEFLTPASSPEPELEPEEIKTRPESDQYTSELSEEERKRKLSRMLPQSDSGGADVESCQTLLYNKMYDRFTVEFKDIQIIIAKVKDNWVGAHAKGNSGLHLVDRFSINLHLHRRTVDTVDPAWPSVVVSGNLPRLRVHFNEEKMLTVKYFLEKMIGPELTGKKVGGSSSRNLKNPSPPPTPDGEGAEGGGDTRSVSPEPLALFQGWEPGEGVDLESRLLLAQFLVSDLALDIQSQGIPVVELQLTSLKAGITRRPFDMNFNLSVQSLLLVDALQSLGPDYELLVASHKHVMVDSVSGSLKGSEPVSPGSPGSPGSPDPFSTISPNHLDITRALSNLSSPAHYPGSPPTGFINSPPPGEQGSRSPLPPGPPRSPALLPALHIDSADPNALITVEVLLVSPSCPTLEYKEHLKIVNVQFNSLDIIANQETIIELIGFSRRVFPENSSARNESFADLVEQEPVYPDQPSEPGTDVSVRTEVTADFQRLNLLLLRAGSGKRIGTALLTDARVQGSFSDRVSASGSLGGLQIINLLSSSPTHQRILSVGREPLIGRGDEANPPLYSSHMDESKQAFTFNIRQHKEEMEGTEGVDQRMEDSLSDFNMFNNPPGLSPAFRNCVSVELQMSSVVYTNSSPFLQELNCCAADFKRCMANLASSITQAAAEMALGIVQMRVGDVQPTTDWNKSIINQGISAPAPTPRLCRSQDKLILRLNAVLQTPVVVFPRNETSLEVLVAHLGQISASNLYLTQEQINQYPDLPPDCLEVERVNISIKNINLNSLNILSKLEPRSTRTLEGQISQLTALRLYECGKFGVPIIHDTSLDITLDLITRSELGGVESFHSGFYLDPCEVGQGDVGECGGEMIRVAGRVMNPLKISLSRNQYKQLLETMQSPLEEKEKIKAESGVSMSKTEEKKEEGKTRRILGTFHLPLLSLELRRDALNADMEPGIVSLTFTDFGVEFEKVETFSSRTEISLKGLIMEDLLLDDLSPHRILMVSSGLKPSQYSEKKTGVSTSCPNLARNRHDKDIKSKSLPGSLDPKFIFGGRPGTLRHSDVRRMTRAAAPDTPPPSACSSPEDSSQRLYNEVRSGENLVNVSITNIDPNHPELESGMRNITRHVMVDFNSLDINFNLETWVVVLNFFGIGSGGDTLEPSRTSSVEEEEMGGKTELEILVKSLSVCFNKQHKDLFQATMLNFSSKLLLAPGNFSMEGELGNFCIKDLTPFGFLYKDRFLCRGEQILRFKFYKYSPPDPELVREYDSSLELEMKRITYTHTQRFINTLIDFFTSFQQLQATIDTFRPPQPNRRVGFKPAEFGKERGTRLLLQVKISSPLLVLPQYWSSTKVLLLDLQSLEIKNMFRFAGDEGTISATKLSTLRSGELGGRRSRVHTGSASSQRSMSSARSRSRRSNRSAGRGMSSDEDFSAPAPLAPAHRCLLDVMNIELRGLDLEAGERVSAFIRDEDKLASDVSIGSCILRRDGILLLKEPAQLKLQLERNLDKGFSHNVPDLSMKGLLSSVHAVVDTKQFILIKGLLGYNLGEQIDTSSDTEDILGAVSEDPNLLWTTMFMDIELQNVSVDLVNQRETSNYEVPDSNIAAGSGDAKSNPSRRESKAGQPTLARVNFIKSRLVYESFSDCSKDVDLVSQEILLLDTRFTDFPANKRANVYTRILQPMKLEERTSLLQAEVHFRSTADVNRFTILLNNMRLMCVLDWWMLVLNFISRAPDAPISSTTEQPTDKKQTRKNVDLAAEPLYPTAGVITRRYPVIESSGPVFELKLNITDSEVVLIADTSQFDSSAVILRSTSVLAYRPDMQEKPLSCNLNNAEVFSCILGKEEETALSIIDPVTVNLEIWGRGDLCPTPKGLMDLKEESKTERVADIQLQQLNIRLSYHDAKMFKHILDSVPRQAQDALAGSSAGSTSNSNQDSEPANIRAQCDQLAAMGFQRSDCLLALKETGGQVDEAAIWLTQNAKPQISRYHNNDSRTAGLYCADSAISFSTIQLKFSSVNLVIIDDCKDADCPLIELSLSQPQLKQQYNGDGELHANISASYYNRELSAWEPFVELWTCAVFWTNRLSRRRNKLSLHIKSDDVINLNITSAMLELYRVVRTNWGEDYYRGEDGYKDEECFQEDEQGNRRVYEACTPGIRRRIPFVPYALYNNTGCTLWFLPKLVSTDSKYTRSRDLSEMDYDQDRTWRQVKDGETVSFAFKTRSKIRHENTHKSDTHLLVVRVEGWKECKQLSVDKVGTFFRNVHAERRTDSLTEIPPARLVFQISLEGSARKLIAVRSALEIENLLDIPFRIRLENIALRVADTKEIEVKPGARTPLPLLYCWANILARPVISSSHQWEFSKTPIHWCHILHHSNNTLEMHESKHKTSEQLDSFRFCVAVCRVKGFPDESVPITPSSKAWIQPAHLISIIPPCTVINLLPCSIQYTVQGEKITGSVGAGQQALLSLDIFTPFIIELGLDGYPGVGSLIIQPGVQPFQARIKLLDSLDRPLYLIARVAVQYGGSVHITIYSQYWLVNKTGLPLVFKQDGEKLEAAGQYDEHEQARMIVPLLFSISNTDSPPGLVVRIGSGVHPEGKTKWCKHFYLQSAASVRRLRVDPPDKRPEWVYIVGIDVRQGRGRYRDTNIVTISPRFQIYNQSPHMLLLSQLQFATSFKDPAAQSTFLTAHPQSSLAFHWPRIDMEQQLSIKLLDISECQWSGGIIIEKVDSFQLSLRDIQGHIHFLRIEISLCNSTFCIVISSAESFPPPFRIDNLSEVSITFHQTGVDDHFQLSMVKPHSSVPYALDAPVLPPHLSITAPGASSATYNMNIDGPGGELTYENFIYLAFTATFDLVWGMEESMSGQELVLDVPEGSRVVLSKKSGAKRSQLWRMTSTGMLQHEGSSPPQDPKKPSDASRYLVLDISGPSVLQDDFVTLSLRKHDPRRSLTQQWKFTEDGRLCCQHSGLYVQAKNGYMGMLAGQDAVLGPESGLCLRRTSGGIPVEQALSRQRLRPGSGFLGVQVLTDGPTRVLQIQDLRLSKDKSTARFARTNKEDFYRSGLNENEEDTPGPGELQVLLNLKGGVGISLITRYPGEELLYITLSNIVIDFQQLPTAVQVDGSVQNIQIDTQVCDSVQPVLLYLSPTNKSDDGRHLPAMHFGIQRTPGTPGNHNVEIFKHFILTVKNLTLNIEEELLYKLYKFISLASAHVEDDETADFNNLDHLLSKMASSPQLSRYYIGTLKLTLNQIKLSVQKSNKLRQDLQETKKKLGLSLITFEDASIELDPFCKTHLFETFPFLSSEIIKHYQDELISQAVLILGSTDFLGNPLGFINDVSEGFSELVSDGNLVGMFKNVTHGAANSTAKMAGSLSYGLSKSCAEGYDERRLMIRKKHSESSRQYLVAGLKGLGFGVLGGLTSMITEPFEGARMEGVTGFFQGVGLGVVGTVTKPAIGLLDFATGAASAVRESSRTGHRSAPGRVRLPRVCQGHVGTLTPYSVEDAKGQAWLYAINGKNVDERFIAFEMLSQDQMIVVSSEKVFIFKLVEGREKVVETLVYSDIITAQSLQIQEQGSTVHYLELILRTEPTPGLAPPIIKRPRVLCESSLIALNVADKINFAKSQHEERRQVVSVD